MLLRVTTMLFFSCAFFSATAQNTSPFWSLAGNSNANTGSKLGTTNAVPLRLMTKNTERMHLDTLGRVGIGISTPQQRLHVEGSSNQTIFVNTSTLGSGSGSAVINYAKALPTAAGQRLGSFSFGSRGGAQNNYVAAGVSGWAAGAWTAVGSRPAYLSFETTPTNATAAVERMRVAANGFVGIGTTAPAYLLDVNGRMRLRSGGAADNTAGLWLNKTDNSGTQGFMGVATPSAMGFYGHTPGWGLVMNTNNGNVGIGNINPDYKLVVQQSGVVSNDNTLLLRLSGRNPLMSFTNENNVAVGYLKSWTFAPYAPFTNGMLIGSHPGYPIFFSTNYGATMTIANNNNVGIGTTTPAHKLSVNGTIQAKEVRVETGWADYVFGDDYKLMPIDDVAAYIKQNNHLPNIPSAQEIQENGLAVGAMQTKLMEKIEELTVYMIQVNKRVKVLEQENASLKNKLAHQKK